MRCLAQRNLDASHSVAAETDPIREGSVHQKRREVPALSLYEDDQSQLATAQDLLQRMSLPEQAPARISEA